MGRPHSWALASETVRCAYSWTTARVVAAFGREGGKALTPMGNAGSTPPGSPSAEPCDNTGSREQRWSRRRRGTLAHSTTGRHDLTPQPELPTRASGLHPTFHGCPAGSRGRLGYLLFFAVRQGNGPRGKLC